MSKQKDPLPPDLLSFARHLREQQTDAEKLIWALLRNRGLRGFKFRRQHPVEPCVLDFYCEETRLAVELDGVQHEASDTRARDERRSEFLRDSGIRVLRFRNEQVLGDTLGVLREIWNALLESPSSLTPGPSPGGRGEQDARNVWK